MTIKQQGGVFGRNPTFNDVEVADLQATNIDLPDNGRLRIGTGDDLQMYHSGSHSYILDAGTGDLKILGQNVEIGALDGTLSFKAISNSYATLYYNNASRARTTFFGLEITSGNLIVPSGNGIDFSATSGTGTSELFDDYEEGTWTPVFQGSTSGSKDLGAIGKYTKIGRMVHVAFYATNADFSSAAIVGTVELSGLPFNIATLGYGLGNIAINNLVTGGSDYVPYPYTADKLRFSAGSTAQLSDTGLTQSASRYIAIALTYEAA